MLALAVLHNKMTMYRRIALKQRLSKPVRKKANLAQGSFCRTCLSSDDLESIFTCKESEKKRSHDLKLVTGLEIKKDDGLSQNICKKCQDHINIALKFRRTSKNAEKSLKLMSPTKKIKKLFNINESPAKKTYKTCKTEEKVFKTKKIAKEETFDSDFGDDFQNYDFGIDDKDCNGSDCKIEVTIDENKDYSAKKQEETAPKVKKKGGRTKRIVLPTDASYECTTCVKVFPTLRKYKAHMRIHTHYCVCETCGKRCTTDYQLQSHKRAIHGLARIHKCSYCEYSANNKEALTIHERLHTGERPYVCDHCGAAFHRRSNLVQHIPIHLPDKNFQCNLCPHREKSKKLLTIHIYRRHRESKYKYVCPVCRNTFVRPRNVRLHLTRSHGVPREEQADRIERVEVDASVLPEIIGNAKMFNFGHT